MFFRRGAEGYFPVPEITVSVDKTLPLGTYSLQFDMEKGFFFQPIDGFELPKKLYGDVKEKTDRILNTFLDRPGGTGVLLAGEKGSGKSLLGKNIAIEAGKRFGMPTIVIGHPFGGEGFNTLIQGIKQDAIIFFDEFEKIYREKIDDRKPQEALLTLLDGTYPTRKLFILTTNDIYGIDSHMRNRPGRIFYLLKYKGLDKEFVREYCQDNLKNERHIDGVVTAASMFEHFNFDLLKAFVEEMNRYDEDAKSVMRLLNAIPESSGQQKYDSEFYIDGTQVPPEVYGKHEFYFDPFGSDDEDEEDEQIIVQYYPLGTLAYNAHSGGAYRKQWDEQNEGRLPPPKKDCFTQVVFTRAELKKIDHYEGTFVFEKEGDGNHNVAGKRYTLILIRKRRYSYDYLAGL